MGRLGYVAILNVLKNRTSIFSNALNLATEVIFLPVQYTSCRPFLKLMTSKLKNFNACLGDILQGWLYIWDNVCWTEQFIEFGFDRELICW